MQIFIKTIFGFVLVTWVGLLPVLVGQSLSLAQDTNLQTLIQRLDQVHEDLRILQKD